MTVGSRIFCGPDGLLISAMLDHDDEQRPALTLVGWCADRTRVEITYSWGTDGHHEGFPAEFWCETALHVLTTEQAVEIVQSALEISPSAVTTRRYRP